MVDTTREWALAHGPEQLGQRWFPGGGRARVEGTTCRSHKHLSSHSGWGCRGKPKQAQPQGVQAWMWTHLYSLGSVPSLKGCGWRAEVKCQNATNALSALAPPGPTWETSSMGPVWLGRWEVLGKQSPVLHVHGRLSCGSNKFICFDPN